MANTDDLMREAMDSVNAQVVEKTITFYPHEIGLLMHLENQDDPSAYVKELIRQDLEAEQEESESSFMDTLIGMIEEKNQAKQA